MSKNLGQWSGLHISEFTGPAGAGDRRMIQLMPSSARPWYTGARRELLELLLGRHELAAVDAANTDELRHHYPAWHNAHCDPSSYSPDGDLYACPVALLAHEAVRAAVLLELLAGHLEAAGATVLAVEAKRAAEAARSAARRGGP